MATDIWFATEDDIAETKKAMKFHQDRLSPEEFLDHYALVLATTRAEVTLLRKIIHKRDGFDV